MDGSSANQFLNQLCNDSALRAQYRTSGATTMHSVLDFALAKGYSFTEAELRAALRDAPDHVVIDQMCEHLKVARSKPAATS